MFYPIWHKDVLSFLPLTNGKGTEETRTRGLDYGIATSKIFYERLQEDGEICLFDPNDLKAKYNIYENFGLESFDELYLKAEADPTIPKTKISAVKLWTLIAQERAETGQVYIINIDHLNSHSAFLVWISQSNLCVEIALPTNPFYSLTDINGEIATCILGAINPNRIADRNAYKKAACIVVRFLDNIIEYQDYPFVMSEIGSKGRRSIGVGFNDFAHWLALNDFKWGSDEMLEEVHYLAEMHQYYLLKASNELAIEKGACSKFNETKYSKGILPIDTYYKNVDNIVAPLYIYDWEALRESILEHGLRNSTLTAQMPCESCLFWEHEIKTSHGFLNFHQIAEFGEVDWETIEAENKIGWYDLKTAIEVETQNGYKTVDKLYFNGHKETFSITLDNDKVIKCTANHRFLVNQDDGTTTWKRAYELTEEDDIVEF